jgi:hypothetical protein
MWSLFASGWELLLSCSCPWLLAGSLSPVPTRTSSWGFLECPPDVAACCPQRDQGEGCSFNGPPWEVMCHYFCHILPTPTTFKQRHWAPPKLEYHRVWGHSVGGDMDATCLGNHFTPSPPGAAQGLCGGSRACVPGLACEGLLRKTQWKQTYTGAVLEAPYPQVSRCERVGGFLLR